MKPKIKFIFLDVGDTLLSLKVPPGKIYLDVLRKHGVISTSTDLENLKQIFSRVWMEMNRKPNPEWKDRYSLHPGGPDGWWIELIDTYINEITGGRGVVSLAEEIYKEIFNQFENPEIWKIESSFSEFLSVVRQRSLGIGIISNWDLRLRKLLQDKGLLQEFSPVLISAEFGYEKPSLKIFQEAMRISGCNPENLVYIGDKVELDYEPPKSMQWNAFILGDPGMEIARLEKLQELWQHVD